MNDASRLAGRSFLSRLGVRLVVTFGLALLPLAVLSYVQTRQYEDESNARAEAAMLGATVQVAAPQIDRIMQARGAVAALAASVPVIGRDLSACQAVMRDIVARNSDVTFAAFIRPAGISDCSSKGEAMDFSDSPLIAQLMSTAGGSVSLSRHGPASGESVLVFTHPVIGRSGRVEGLVALSVPHRMLPMQQDRKDAGLPTPDAILTFDGEGEILTSSVGLDAAALSLPANRPLASFVGEAGQSFTALSTAGRSQVFAIVPLVKGSLYVLAQWPAVRPRSGLIDPAVPEFRVSGPDVGGKPAGGAPRRRASGLAAYPHPARDDHQLCRWQSLDEAGQPSRGTERVA